MSALKIKLLSPKNKSPSFVRVKKAAKRLRDENFEFCFLPRLPTIYEDSPKGALLRRQAFTGECDLLAVFFYPDDFDASAKLLLEAMEFFGRTVVIVDTSSGKGFNTDAFSESLCIASATCDGSAASVTGVLELIRTYAVSLLYSSPSFINYGPDAECALDIVSYGAKAVFGAKKLRWAASRLLRGGAFSDELFTLFGVSGERRAAISGDVKRALEYLERCTPPVDFAVCADNVISGISQALKEASQTEKEENEAAGEQKSIFICAIMLSGLFALAAAVIFLID